MGSSAYYCPCGAQWHRYLPPSLVRVDDTTLFSRRWELLVLSAAAVARLATLPRLPRCRTVLLPQGAGLCLPVRQTVDCGLSRRSSLTLSSLSSPPVLCVQRRLTAVDGTPLEIQDIPLPCRWSQLPPEPLLLTAGAWLLTAASLPD